MSTTSRRTTMTGAWTGAVLVPAVLLIALGCWVFFVPLVGSYFHFGFDTTAHWRFSPDHWLLSLIPGAAIALAGVLMLLPSRAAGWFAGLLAVAAGVWLVIGPSLQPLWSSTLFRPLPAGELKTAARWIAYFYGPGALAVYLGAQAQGLLERRAAVAEPASSRDGRVVGPHSRTPTAGRT